MNKLFLKLTLLMVAVLALSIPVTAKTIGTFGATYAIAEPDALAEIMERAKKADWSKYFNKELYTKKILEHERSFEYVLPKAKVPSVRMVDMTYTLTFDIRDINGKVVYPKGFTFKPSQYMPMPYSIVVIDGSDKAQVRWLKSSGYGTKVAAMVLTTGGETEKLMKDLKRPVYVADHRIVERFQVRAVPSVIVQKGLDMEVTEIVVPEKK